MKPNDPMKASRMTPHSPAARALLLVTLLGACLSLGAAERLPQPV